MAAPGLNEIVTTTEKSDTKKAIKDVQKSGTHVPEKDTSSKKKQVKATGVMSSAPAPAPSAPEKKSWEGSGEDWQQDYNSAKRRGKTVEEYEGSAHDRIADAAGERRMKAESPKTEVNYKKSGSSFANVPKSSHGYGHPTTAKDGHLRHSGHSGAHRIGKKK